MMPTQEKTDDRLDGSTSEEDVGVVGESVNSSTTDHEDIMSGSHHPPEEERKENTMAEAVSGSNGATTEQAGDEKHRSLKTVPKPPDRKAEVPAGSASKAAIYKSSEEATTTASEAVKPASGKPGPPEESDRVQPELPGDENEKLAAKIADKNTSNDSHNNQAQDQAPLPTALRRENHISASATTPGAFAIAVTPTTPPTNDIMNVSQEEEGASTNNHISETAEEEGHSPFHTTSSNDDNNNSHSSTEEVLLSATLVPDSSPMNRDDMEEQQLEVHPLGEIMEAKPAPEGFRAIVSNKRFKYLLASFVSVVIVATVTPLALLIPKSKEKQSTQQVTVVQNTDRECGTRWLKQADYRGQVNVTETGKTCQRWDSQIPHSHVFNPDSEPGLEHNFCRNPGREPRAWCYTTDPDVRFEFCDIPYCDEEESELTNDNCGTIALRQEDYRGTVNYTATGRTCQRWDSNSPHRNELTPESHPKAGLEDNYCRNPDGRYRAYCYTTDPEVQWEFCDILPCGSPDALQNETCEDCSNLQCGTNRIRQADYRGTINVTESGIPCQRWDAEEPHDLFFTPKDFPNDGLIENYCRNPSPEVDNRAWCYTTDPDKRWEFCKVPYCKDDFVPRRQCGTISKKQQDYRGEIAVTESGKTCVDWHESPNAAVDRYVSAEHPAAGLVDNYCRNPIGTHGRVRAWCYTDGLDIDWEYCPVDACHECGTPELNKTDYRGDEAKTASGKVCQHWLDTWPRNEVNGTNVFFDEWGLEGNFCRNPGGERKDAWCYVDSNTLEWELCNVTSCNDEDPGMTTITYDTCGTLGTKQADYRGLVNITESGIPCQSWDSQDPHRHKLTSEERPHNGLYGNFCRNPDNSERAWCYTENPDVLWEYCEVPLC